MHGSRIFFALAVVAAMVRAAAGQTTLAPVDQAPYATFDTTDQVVRLSNPSEPIQFTVVPQAVPAGVPVYGAPAGVQFGEPWSWQLLPEGLIYRSYLAGVREPRLGIVPFYEFDRDAWLIDATIGARVGLLRYGNEADIRPEGFQLDLEAAAFPRLDPDSEMDLVATDFRVGVPLTWGNDLYQVKLAYYHLSSHIADEFLLVNPAFPAAQLQPRRDRARPLGVCDARSAFLRRGGLCVLHRRRQRAVGVPGRHRL